MFGFLSGLDAETQQKIVENWNKMLKEKKEKEKEAKDKEKMFKFIRENPPKSFKDMMICGQIMKKYGS
jgi:hypothetical protein|tara:strand:+ start:134 stop:337 length:204 start_codon:yes stop_codon:yes gene_type:complete